MKKREQVKLLLDAGFKLKRLGSKHEIYTNGRDTVAISRGGGDKTSPCTLASFKSKMRKARRQIESFQI